MMTHTRDQVTTREALLAGLVVLVAISSAACAGAPSRPSEVAEPLSVDAALPEEPVAALELRPAAILPHPIVEADGRLYVVFGAAGEGVATGQWQLRRAAVGADVDVSPLSRLEALTQVTLVGLDLPTCVARAERLVSLRIYDEADSIDRGPTEAWELEQGGACPIEDYSYAQLAFAIQGKHPEARLDTAGVRESLGPDEGGDYLERLEGASWPSHIAVDGVSIERFYGTPVSFVVATLRGPSGGSLQASALVVDGRSAPVADDLDLESPFELRLEGRALLVWQSWPRRLRFAAVDDGRLSLLHDLESPLPFDYYGGDDCGC